MKGKEKKKEQKKEKTDNSNKQPSEYQREKARKGEKTTGINPLFK